jgi:hypothetical protein
VTGSAVLRLSVENLKLQRQVRRLLTRWYRATIARSGLAAELAETQRDLAVERDRSGDLAAELADQRASMRRVDRVRDWEMAHNGMTMAVERLSCALVGTDDDLTRLLAEHDAFWSSESAAHD